MRHALILTLLSPHDEFDGLLNAIATISPTEPSLGRMLSEAQSFIFSRPMMAVFPGLVIVVMILGFSLLSGALE